MEFQGEMDFAIQNSKLQLQQVYDSSKISV